MKRYRKSLLLFCFLSILVFFLSQCIQKQNDKKDARGKTFARSESCRKCHQAVYDSYVASSHYSTSKPTSAKNLSGKFTNGKSIFSYHTNEKVVLEDRDSGLFQVQFTDGKQQRAHRMDITFGVKNGQTFLYWKGNNTFQLPVSYYAAVKNWGTSPGFTTDHADFNRLVQKQCFECHTSYIDSRITGFKKRVEELDKSSLVYGIDCERCHGPASDHVSFQTSHPELKQAKFIAASGSLSVRQKSDMCAICHSGSNLTKDVNTFFFKLGDTLSRYTFKSETYTPAANANIDVHGNQLQLLASSECFIKSKTLTCTTCHNPHTNASANITNYSAKCISCHQNVSHTFDKSPAVSVNSINNNCIDCHMPRQPSRSITFLANGKTEKTPQMFRTHKIAVYHLNDKKVAAIADFIKRKKDIIELINKQPPKI